MDDKPRDDDVRWMPWRWTAEQWTTAAYLATAIQMVVAYLLFALSKANIE